MNYSEQFEFVTHMLKDERSVILKMSFSVRIVVGATLILSLVWGSLMKLFIYYSLWQEKLSKRPINILIFLDQIIDHVTKAFAMITILIMVSK